jgi:hypothetical protein
VPVAVLFGSEVTDSGFISGAVVIFLGAPFKGSGQEFAAGLQMVMASSDYNQQMRSLGTNASKWIDSFRYFFRKICADRWRIMLAV